MPYVSCNEMIEKAHKGNYAVPAFNGENLEMIQAIIAAATLENSPVIIQTTKPTAIYLGYEEAVAIVSSLAKKTHIPVALHFDHATLFDDVMYSIKAGYSSVMMDGSSHTFEENVLITKKVVDASKPMGISVEGELGKVGGKEDDINENESAYTIPAEAKEFAKRTNVDFLAIAIGTAHGFYSGKPKIAFDILEEIRDIVETPIVLHGGSGIEAKKIKRAISIGISKVNFATELRDNFTNTVRHILKDPDVFDPKKYLGPAREGLKDFCIEKIKICGSTNKA